MLTLSDSEADLWCPPTLMGRLALRVRGGNIVLNVRTQSYLSRDRLNMAESSRLAWVMVCDNRLERATL